MAPFAIGVGHSLLDEVVVMGFPPIPTSAAAYVVAKGGEISSEIELRGHDGSRGHEILVVSSLLPGGNSGAPVVNRRGAVVGIVWRNLEILVGSTSLAPACDAEEATDGDANKATASDAEKASARKDGISIIEGLGYAAAYTSEWIQDSHCNEIACAEPRGVGGSFSQSSCCLCSDGRHTQVPVPANSTNSSREPDPRGIGGRLTLARRWFEMGERLCQGGMRLEVSL